MPTYCKYFKAFIFLFAVQILESLPDRAATHQSELGAVPSAAGGGARGRPEA